MLIIEFVKVVTAPLTRIFQLSTQEETVLQYWKNAFVNPFFREGDRSNSINYQSISSNFSILQSTRARSAQSDDYPYMKISMHLERKDHVTQLPTTIANLDKGLNDKVQINAVFLDLSKAFDKRSQRQ